MTSDPHLTFLDQELQSVDTGYVDDTPLTVMGDGEWDPNKILAEIDGGIGDFHIELAPSSNLETQSSNQPGNATTSTGQVAKKQLKSKKKRKKQLNSNRARDERRYEVVQLRREAEDLELTLQQLKTIRSQRERDMENRSTESTEEDANGIPAVWQDICTRQLDRRLKAEKENARLKKQWEEEKRVAKSIEKMLFKKMALRDTAQPGASKHTRRTNLPDEYIKRIAAFIFDELSASVEVSYRETEGIFTDNGPVPKNVMTHQPMLRGGMKGMYRRLFDKRFVPFTPRETGDAWWKYWHNYRGQRIQDIKTDVVTESFGLEMTDLKTDASVTSYGQQILQRHVEENRIVFVWNAYIEPFVFKTEPVSGVYLLEQSYVLIKLEDPDYTVDGKTDACSTSMSTCYVITPHFLDPKLKNDPETITLIDFLTSGLSSQIKVRNDTVENLLLDQALQKHNFTL
ncbi:hypothetical protein PHPALM_31580 [Phytophthora palmivora]|uniref:M96 mating-specific protein family n=1 Tax=Phytophthora palmivora TaxID=4796 RepID=A0A2P4X282_9STRA|nr:hypothetical protein PHPALM_31580 [Phytophthora palmivora]